MSPSKAESSQPQASQTARQPNRLIHETSPYLLQHAHNPVQWFAWGSEAFEAARAADKPIFLSVGYSTCYWCHVMERESFENEEIAAIMNEHFICIKVDREERPDVDEIYMAATQMLSGSGGWPMSVFLDPHTLKPFLAGTYFPPADSFGRPGFPRVLSHVSNIWKTQRDAVKQQSEQTAAAVKEHLAHAAQPASVGGREVEKAIGELLNRYDSSDGGFGGGIQRAPKFPTPVNLEFLMGAAWDIKQAREATLYTLDRMAIGGIFDHVGGGFHRYSVDEKWLVPHFEKMLYDNGQLASAYAKAFELNKDDFHAQVVRRTLDYVLREMTSPDGGFYSAQDAEVNGQEGANYLWTADEVRAILEAEGRMDETQLALDVYGLSKGPNFQDPHHAELPAKNVLFLIDRPDRIASRRNLAINDLNARLELINNALLNARSRREQPRLDDKILAGWNGLMIAGMAEGGRVLNERKYKDAALRAAQFVLANMRGPDGGLQRSYRSGKAQIDAFLEDYALMIRGLIALHRATNDRRVLEDAKRLAQMAKTKFWDASNGGFFDTLENQSDLFVRVKSVYDDAIASANAVMLHNLLDLHDLTGHAAYLDDAAAALKSVSASIAQHPSGLPVAVLALHRFIKRYPQRLEGGGGARPPAPTAFGQTAAPVKISVSPKEIDVKPGSSATFNITIQITKPFHINAHEPGEEFLVPLKVSLTGCEGLNIVPEYPKGESYTGEFADGTIFVHSGTVTFPVRVEQTGRLTGTPQLSITYQMCTDKECLEPKTDTLGVRIVAQR